MTEFVITCQSELQKDGSYRVERYRELVRCKDCKHRFDGCCYNKKNNRISFGVYVADNWFCADGDRRTEDA